MEMDPYTQQLLERAEKRSKALGITSTSKFPLQEYNNVEPSNTRTGRSPTKTPKKTSSSSSITRTPNSTTRITRNVSERDGGSESKENVDLAVEINITTAPNIQVQVEVEEKDIDEHGNIIESTDDGGHPNPIMRDTSRTRLQRLGALYSETENLSSPIHRTEGRFHAEDTSESTSTTSNGGGAGGRGVKRFGKLAALADSISNWEDDLSHHDIKPTNQPQGPPKPKRLSSPKKEVKNPTASGAVAKKYPAPAPPRSEVATHKSPGKQESTPKPILTTKKSTNPNAKRLNWDQKVMDALESQGFQRRDSQNAKLVYDYNKDVDQIESVHEMNKPEPQPRSVKPPAVVPGSEIEKKEAAANKPGDKITKGLVSGRAAIFETQSQSSATSYSSRNQKDPAEMSLKDRMALFEKNKGHALIPKAPLGMSASAKQIMGDPKPKEQPQIHKVSAYNKPTVAESKAQGLGIKNTVAALLSTGSTISESKISEETKKQRQQEMDQLMNRFTKPADSRPEQKIEKRPSLAPPPPPMPPTDYTHVDAIVNVHKRRSGDSKENLDSPEVISVLDDVKRIKVNPPKEGRLYPALSDLETTESDEHDYTTASVGGSESDCVKAKLMPSQTQTKPPAQQSQHQPQRQYYDEDEDSYMDSEDSSVGQLNGSLGREILNMVRRNETYEAKKGRKSNDKQYSNNSSATGSEMSDVLGDIDAYLDDEDDDDDDDEEEQPEEKTTPKKSSMSSNSFSYQKNVKHVRYETIDEDEEVELRPKSKFRTPVKSELTVNPSKDNDMVTLVHTVSFYRRQQMTQSTGNTPVKKIQRPVTYHETTTTSTENDDDSLDSDEKAEYEDTLAVQDKVKKLFDEVGKQQTIMAQTSQALNLCAATIEFSGSTEAVEGERHLLVASHRRQAALDEIQRLRVEGSLRPMGAPQERGRLSINEVTVPLKQDYIKKLAADTITGHHLVCLLKYNEHVLATKAIPTLPGLVAVKFPDTLQLANVYADFKVTLEIYGMTAQKEILPHEIKYHIAMNKKHSKILTPKGKKGGENRLHMPPVQSPAGPNAIRTPALSYYGFVIFSLREIQRTSWSLNQCSGVSPLEGTVHMKVNCELSVSVDHRGFLTMFEDVSGFGAWHRRWCRLNGHVLSYWKYPDDEKKKPPISSIDLYNCCSQKVSLAPRDVCARLNTMLLEIRRPCQEDDVESLVLVRQGKFTVLRHLLSADTKEEREEWCAFLNKSLALIRAWGPPPN